MQGPHSKTIVKSRFPRSPASALNTKTTLISRDKAPKCRLLLDYHPVMRKPQSFGFHWRAVFGWRRLAWAFLGATGLGCLWLITWESDKRILFGRMYSTALIAVIAFGAFEHWPRRLPRWIERWVLQVGAVALVIPVLMFLHYRWSELPGSPFWRDLVRLSGFLALTMSGLLIAPWIALTALIRQKAAFAQAQAMAFDLERSELARQASDARLQLLQAQVAPHFLFNTLANVHALVQSGSPKAAAVLASLIVYLRAAVPQLHRSSSTVGEELVLAQAYLALMYMRMPDRLEFALDVAPSCLPLKCPPMLLVTLVENAIKHGIDPNELGGNVSIVGKLIEGRCQVSVSNSGAWSPRTEKNLGTGLDSLRARLNLAFQGEFSFNIKETNETVCVNIAFPAICEP
jgi:hypothetical protein